MANRESMSIALTVLSILANSVLILAWFVALHLGIYSAADNAVMLIPYYLFGLIFCVPVSAANEFVLVRWAVSTLRTRWRLKRLAIAFFVGAGAAGIFYGAMRVVIVIANGLQDASEPISIIAAWIVFASLLLFQLVVAIAPPCFVMLLVRLSLGAKAVRSDVVVQC